MANQSVQDLLKKGVFLDASKGLVTVSTNLNLSASDFKTVASKLLCIQNSKLPTNSNIILTDSFGDSDGFTSESSDTNSIFLKAQRGAIIKPNLITPITNWTTSDSESINFVESVGTDSDVASAKVDLDEALAFPQQNKLPTKKRGGWPKGRKRKPELLHLPPKPPSTGYNIYLNDQRKYFKDPSLPFHEVTKLIGNKWSSLSVKEKEPYLKRAEEDKKRYREEFWAYRQSKAYQQYIANKRRKRAHINVLSESDMDATDEVDDEDYEELYCQTCNQWFNNHHNKREHSLGRQHMQMLAGAINKELNSDYDTDSTSTSTATTSKKIQPEKPTTTTQSHSRAKSSQPTIQKAMEILTAAVKRWESEYKTTARENKELAANLTALSDQLNSLKERKRKLKADLESMKEEEKDLDLKLYSLWRVPSLFVLTDLECFCNDDFLTLE